MSDDSMNALVVQGNDVSGAACIAVNNGYFSTEQLAAFVQSGWQVVCIATPVDLTGRNCTMLCLTPALLAAEMTRAQWQAAAPQAVLVVDETVAYADEIHISPRWPVTAIANTFSLADAKARQRQIEAMFEGFVAASVSAVEQRDLATGGHAVRVSRMSAALAEALPRSGQARFRDAQFTAAQLRELRYAALLHDFGKIGVREHVLVKAHKLTQEDYLAIRGRITIEAERLKRRALAQQLVMLRSGMESREELQVIEQELQEKLASLNVYWAAIQEANEPDDIPPRKRRKPLEIPVQYSLSEEGTPLLTAEEQRVLSLPRGSLTPDERHEIEAHVLHTYDFLRRIPWSSDLASLPEIVAAHHEKLDGSGYPHGLAAADIPLASRIITIADIYDALTGADRPYRKSLTSERAFRVLEDEARSGKLDVDLVRVFIEAKVFGSANEPNAGQ